jgi:hypothetical protein
MATDGVGRPAVLGRRGEGWHLAYDHGDGVVWVESYFGPGAAAGRAAYLEGREAVVLARWYDGEDDVCVDASDYQTAVAPVPGG